MPAIVSEPLHSWHTNRGTFSMPASPESCTPLLFVSLKTVPHTPPDAHSGCADAGVAATDASGRRTAASAAPLTCFSGPSSNWVVRSRSSVWFPDIFDSLKASEAPGRPYGMRDAIGGPNEYLGLPVG